ncbi:A/G-specific adenine glycosylase [Geopsychrobacter electrodiphilus]|uniref:A/G-specific adenine glycosylase n=1 Tax=Geopsychrobacter electrodiphilus TaxID=225196 RepID=UPI00036426FC|nr:A/G-specific adenine glycosylase [Geopsychrobacter electrodiphilus]
MAERRFEQGEVATRLLAWYGRAGRSLPWRQTRDPYRIWLAEIMLQQTTVAAVIGYFRLFLEKFPTLEALAAAPLEEVIDLWAGLGYYARARNLHATAQKLIAQGGHFPVSVAELMQLPGIGRSTAGAISALAFDQPAPILDANVRRILCRLFALQKMPRSVQAEKQLWVWAETLTPQLRIHDYTQAIMDLGATICLPRRPRCTECPLETLCEARRLNLVDQLPLKKLKQPIPLRHELALLLVSDGKALVRRRPTKGLLGGLWEFPGLEVAETDPVEQIHRYCAGGYSVRGISLLGQARHTYSHFRLEIDFYRVELEPEGAVAEQADHSGQWLPLAALMQLPLHGAHKKLLTLITASKKSSSIN